MAHLAGEQYPNNGSCLEEALDVIVLSVGALLVGNLGRGDQLLQLP